VFGVLAGYKNAVNQTKETGVKDTVYGPVIGMIVIAPMAVNASFYSKPELSLYQIQAARRIWRLSGRQSGMDLRDRI